MPQFEITMHHHAFQGGGCWFPRRTAYVTWAISALQLLLLGGGFCSGQLVIDISVAVAESDGLFSYEYTVANTSSSTMAVNSFAVDLGPGADPAVTSPAGWFSDYDPEEANFQLVWLALSPLAEIEPNQSAVFRLESVLLPGARDYFLGSVVGESALGVQTGVVDAPSRPRSPPGDFNGDGLVNVHDIDLLAAAIPSGANERRFDLTKDAIVNAADLDAFLTLANRLPGDADFDGIVQFSDFVSLGIHFGQSGTWSQGDFDASAKIEFADFVSLANHFGQSSGVASVALPEPPHSAPGLLIALGLPWAARRRFR